MRTTKRVLLNCQEYTLYLLLQVVTVNTRKLIEITTTHN